MFKKLLASAMSIIMIITVMMAVPVSAETVLPDNIGTDYEPSEVTGNVLGSELTASLNYNGNSKREGETQILYDVAVGKDTTTKYTKLTAYRDIDDPHKSWTDSDGDGIYTWDGATYNYSHALSGGTVTVNFGDDATKKGNVVYKFSIKNGGSVSPVVVNVGRSNNTYANTTASKVEYPAEYNSKATGVSITSTDWTEFAGTFTSNGTTAAGSYTYTMGLAQGNLKGALVWVDSVAYMGLEYAYDIEVAADDTELYYGKSITVDTDVVNQVGITGGIPQGVTWYVTNEARDTAVSGFTIEADEYGQATVSAEDTVPAGTYKLIAVADADSNLVKAVTVTVKASPYEDYVPGAITGNVITTENLASGNYVGGWGGGAATTVNDESVWQVTTSSQVPDTANNANSFGVLGRIVGDYTKADVYEAGKGVVVSYQAKLDTGSPVMKIALWQSGQAPLYTIEKPGFSDGVAVTNTDWQTYSHTLLIPESGFVGANNVNLSIGLAYTGLTESRRGYYIKGGSVYVGKEYVYDIDVTAEDTTLYVGGTTTVDADILNQGGNTGTLSQDVTWYALSDDRREEISGITVTPGENGTATVAVADTVPSGTYDIVAVSDDYSGIQKGVSITVKLPYEDYTPGEVTGNVLTEEGFWASHNAGVTTYSKINEGTDVEAWSFTTTQDVAETIATGANNAGAAGLGINDNYGKSTFLTAGKSIVIGAKVVAGSGSPVMNVGMYQYGAAPVLPVEYPVGEGMAVSASGGWQNFGATIKIPETGFAGAGNSNLYVGFAYTGKTGEGHRTLAIKTGSMYIGEEYAYDINVWAADTELNPDKTITVNSEILNQVGSTGTLSQNVTWYAVTADRKATVDGFTFTEGAEGTATVSVADTVEPGEYAIVAISDDNEELIKGVSIEVTEKAQIEGITITETSGGITVATDTALDNAQLIFVTYEGGKMVAVNNATKVTLSAQGTQEYPVPAGFENAQVMLWSKDYKPLANVIE